MSFVEDLFSLRNKIAVVIGGGGVLAGTMSVGLAKAGANVAVLDLNLENAKKVARHAAGYGVKSIAIKTDVTSKKDIEDACEQVTTQLGLPDILINAPGINSATPFFEISVDEWDKIMNVNLRSMFLACQIFGKKMVESGNGGSIINISSASSGPPLSKVFTYSVSKSGVNNLTQNLAREWAPYKVRVNALAPGFFPAEQNRKVLTKERVTDIMRHTPMQRFGDPEELVGAVLWLASEKASSFATGSVVRVDGGFTAMTI